MGVKFSDSVKMGVGLAAGFFVFMLAIAFVFGGLGNLLPGSTVGGGQSQTAPAPGGVEALPLKVFVGDAVSGGTVDGTVYVIGSDGKVIETITVADGTGTSKKYYDYPVTLFFSASGYTAKPVEFDPSTAKTIAVGDQQYYEVDLYAYATPTEAGFGMLALAEDGSVLADESTGNTYTMTDTDTTFTLQFTVPAGTGLIGYYDPVEDESDDLVLVIAINDTLATLDSGQRVEYGGNVYYVITLSDMVATKDDPAVFTKAITLYYGGSSVLSISVSFYNNVDPSIIASSLTADSDTTLSDSLAAFYIS